MALTEYQLNEKRVYKDWLRTRNKHTYGYIRTKTHPLEIVFDYSDETTFIGRTRIKCNNMVKNIKMFFHRRTC